MKYVTLALIVLGLWACSPTHSADLVPAATAPHMAMQPTKPTDAILTLHTNAVELVSVRADGRIFLRGKEVHTDAQYRAAIKGIMLGAMGCTNERQLEDAIRVEDAK